jgi:chemotaxis protein MotA
VDKISVLGLVFGILAIVLGQVFEGGSINSLVQPTAFFIVIGGTLGAVMLQSSPKTFVLGTRMVRWVLSPPQLRPIDLVRQIVQWSHVARKEGLLALEAQIPAMPDPFVRRGLQLLVDGAEPQGLREVLEVEIGTYEAQMKLAAKVWESAGGYAPTIGILGAVMGLIQVMENLSDPSKLGSGIAVAFVATIYGVGSANLIFLPIAKKLMAVIQQLVLVREMYVDGLVGIANGDNPRMIESRLRGYFA